MKIKHGSFYDRIAWLWNRFTDRYSRTIIHPLFLKRRLEYRAIEEAKRHARGLLVDIGCGRMTYRHDLEPYVVKYIGVDHPTISAIYRNPRKPEVYADASKLPFEDGTFDIALLLEVTELLPDPISAFGEIGRIVKPNGILILLSPFLYSIHDEPYDWGRYTDKALTNFVERSSFQVIKVEKLGGFLDFWTISLLVFLWKRIKDMLSVPLTFRSVIPFGILISVAIPLTLVGNCIVACISPLTELFSQYPNNFPLDILVVARKKHN